MRKRVITIVVVVIVVAAGLAAAHLLVTNWPGILEGVRRMHGR
jgi:hypothetical protein